MKVKYFAFAVALLWSVALYASDPMATNYSYAQCQGSLRPYPLEVEPQAYPDSLVPVMINHVGRHGARYPASSAHTEQLNDALNKARAAGTITPLGEELLTLTEAVMRQSAGRWGALDSLGEYEQRMLATRMYKTFKPVFEKCRVQAISSYSPRVMMSMYAFNHQLDRLNNRIEFATSTGRVNSALLRPFDTDPEYQEFRKSDALEEAYHDYFIANCPGSAIERVMGCGYQYADSDEKLSLAITEYYVLAGLSAMSMPCDLKRYFTIEEINALWSCFNLRQYLQRTSSVLSSVPSDIACALLLDLIDTTDRFVAGEQNVNVYLRFGHAETLLPLVSLMRLPGCYYMTNYFDTVGKNWKDFDIVPMAANLHLILFKHAKTGKYYVRLDLNERPVAFLPNSTAIYVAWDNASTYLRRCLPIYAQ